MEQEVDHTEAVVVVPWMALDDIAVAATLEASVAAEASVLRGVQRYLNAISRVPLPLTLSDCCRKAY